MASINYLTADGLKKLQNELHEIKTVRRREVASRIEAAKALGDLSENAEYTEALSELAALEGRVLEIEDVLKNMSVIQEGTGTTKTDVVRIGYTVVVRVGSKERTFTIVGSSEADPVGGKISNESPIGSAILGAKLGEKVSVEAPGGTTIYEILDIKS